jgi:DNA-binding transcriptional ArsR family regulator
MSLGGRGVKKDGDCLSKERIEKVQLSDVSTLDVLAFFELIFRTDVRFRIISCLANREGACLREIARNVGMSHKNLAKYLEKLMQKGVLEAFPVGLGGRVYKLANKYEFVKEFRLQGLFRVEVSSDLRILK